MPANGITSALFLHLGDDASPSSLSLDLIKNNCHPRHEKCPSPVGSLVGVMKIGEKQFKGIAVNLPCNKWSCKVCNKKRKKELKRRLYKGGITEFVEKKGFRSSPYAFKMLTLTCPGKEYRKKNSPVDALVEMNKSLHKLMRAMKKRWGMFHYLRITEPHKDHYPHFHILIVGHAIARKTVLDQIRSLWTHKYGMGNVDIQVLRRGLGAGVNYVMKYLTKNLQQIAKRKRIFTASKGALERKEKPEWEDKKFSLHVVIQKEKIEELEICPQTPGWLEEGMRKAFINKTILGIEAPF
jgi:hypothetical protein